jgi:4-hydroxy-2-oxoheptanedioate aldolase
MSGSLRDAVLSGERLIGTTVCLPGAAMAELTAEPFDLVWIDLEHSPFGPLDAQDVILGAQAAGAYALGRIPADAHRLMAQMLDAGIDGIVLADVRDAATAQAAAQLMRHPPDGDRGYGPRRLSLRRRGTGLTPARPSLWVQIESEQGVRDAEQIAAVDGVDAVVVGTADLSFALGTPLQTGSPQVRAAVHHIQAAALSAGKTFGLAGALDANAATLATGASILVLGTDARLCAAAVDAAAQRMRAIFNDDPQEIKLS